jgi:hypothetical protein
MPTDQRPLKVYISYAAQDEPAARKLYDALKGQGWIDPWLDRVNILPGQDRDVEIPQAVRASDTFVICLSGYFKQAGSQQRELRIALDANMEQPEGEIFMIPARLEDCEIPHNLRRFQAVDLFTDTGFEKLIRALRLDAQRRNIAIQPDSGQAVGTNILVLGTSKPEETPKLPSPLLAALERLRFLLDIKYISILIAILVLFFGNNIYQQITGHSIFAPAPTPTSTATVAFTSTSTFTAIPTSTETFTPTPSNTPEPTFTFTPVPPTDTITPTLTVVPPVALGQDWIAGCISTLWIPYPSSVIPSERGDGCWKEPLHVFTAENGDLDFLAQRRNGPVEISGLFAPLPERGTVTVHIRLRELNNVDLWVGIFAEADINSDGLLMIVPAGDLKQRPFVQKNPRDYETITSTRVLDLRNPGYSISFRFTENSARSAVNPGVFGTTPASIASARKWLFLGYRGARGPYRVDATFLSFELGN